MIPQDKGREFENNVHSLLKQTNKKILREAAVKSTYGKNISAIDHLIISDEFFITIQDKLEKTRPCISKIHHFIKSTEVVSDIAKKECIGIYLSKEELSKPSKDAFVYENNRKRKFISITGPTENEMIENLYKYLHKLKIFRYDMDGSCIMDE